MTRAGDPQRQFFERTLGDMLSRARAPLASWSFHPVEFSGDRQMLVWTSGNEMREGSADDRLLARFSQIREADDAAGFAAGVGGLELCRHLVPWSHAPQPGPQGCRPQTYEPIEFWIRLSRATWAAMTIGRVLQNEPCQNAVWWSYLYPVALHFGTAAWNAWVLDKPDAPFLGPADPRADERLGELMVRAATMEEQRKVVTGFVSDWLQLSGIAPSMAWDVKARHPHLAVTVRSSGLFAALGLQLVDHLRLQRGYADRCVSCGSAINPKPRKRYCERTENPHCFTDRATIRKQKSRPLKRRQG